MHAILIRHAEAVDETLALRDPHRHLTARGREQARTLGLRLAALAIAPTAIWTSPLVRALQTAELVALGMGTAALVEVVPALAPDGSQHEVAGAVRALAANTCVMLVGHEPSMSAIGGLLVGGPSVDVFEILDKAQAARIVDGQLHERIGAAL